MSEAAATTLVHARRTQVFVDTNDLVQRSQLQRRDLELLAGANALASLAGNRHHAAWALAGVETDYELLANAPTVEAPPLLRAPTEGQSILADFRSTGLSLRRHPLALLRDRLLRRGFLPGNQVLESDDGVEVRFVGLVTLRQTPSTAKQTTFMTLEDETAIVQVIVWNSVAQEFRAAFFKQRVARSARHLPRPERRQTRDCRGPVRSHAMIGGPASALARFLLAALG